MTVYDTFLTGSYSRSTMIAPLKEADIDIFVVLNEKYFHHYDNGKNGGQGGLLNLLKRTIQKSYSTTAASRNGQAVTIKFSDFRADVVAGFYRVGGGFLITNSSNNTWLPTDPKKHVDLMTAANKVHANDLVPLVKMIKAWNKSNGAYFRSFHLEVLSLQIFNNVTISDFPSGARFFFDKARELVKLPNYDPAGYGDDVGRYVTVADAVNRLETAYNRALKAEQFARDYKIVDAVRNWRLIFGDYFPAYG
jgi:hypothetical protein